MKYSSVIDVGMGGLSPVRAGRPRLKSRSIENPSVPLSAAVGEDWDTAWGIDRTDSGVKVSRRTALSISGLFRGCQRISRDVAKIPIFVYRYLDGGGKDQDRTHPAHALLRRDANPQMTAFTVRQTLQLHALLRGNGYGYIQRAGDMTPLEIWPLSPDHTWPVRVNGQLLFVTQFPKEVDGESGRVQYELRKLPARDVLHVKGMSYDGLTGENVIRHAAQSLGLNIANRRYASKFFLNSGTGRIVLTYPGELSEEAAARLKKGFERATAGLDNAHKTVVLEMGGTATNLAVNARDAQLVEAMKAGLIDVANWLGMPVHMVGGEGRTAYASLEMENQSYLDEALDGWFCAWEAELISKLLTEEQKNQETHTIAFRRQALVRANMSQRFAAYKIGVDGQWLLPDEPRELEDMNPLPNGQGKVLKQQGSGAGADSGTTEDTEGKKKEDERKAAARLVLLDALRRMTSRLAIHAKKHAKDLRTLDAWRAAADREQGAAIHLALHAPLANARAAGILSNDSESVVSQLIDQFTSAFEGIPTGEHFARDVGRIADRQVVELPALLAG